MNNVPLPWTDELLAEIKKRWMEGDSAGVIQKAIGAPFTRNAILGQIFRAGLARRPGFVSSNLHRKRRSDVVRPPRPPRAPKTVAVVATPPGPLPSLIIDPTNAKLWTERRQQECAYLIGDGMACCGPTDRGQSYCAGHRAILYRPTANLRGEQLARRYE